MAKLIKIVVLAVVCGSLIACARTKDIPLSVHSDPLGSYVMMQLTYTDSSKSDWLYLGVSPVQLTRKFNLSSVETVSIKVLREGYFEQAKTWEIDDFLKEFKKQGRIVWVPHLVTSGG